MSHQREIDRWPEPTTQRGMKLVVVSCSRTGTLGLYEALRILGYRSYHMAEIGLVGGPPHMKVLEEAVMAHKNRFSGIKRYGKEEFDKWLANYDALIELPSYLGTDAIEVYLEDPNVKFILTERDPDKWVSSFNLFVGEIVTMQQSFPFSVVRYFEYKLGALFRLNEVLYDAFSDSIPYRAKGNEEALRRNYIEYIKAVKRTIPPERMCVIKLEDGLGWEQICPYLDKQIPNVPYPKGTGHKEMTENYLKPIVNRALMKMAAVVTPVLGVGAWFMLQHSSWLVSALKGMRY